MATTKKTDAELAAEKAADAEANHIVEMAGSPGEAGQQDGPEIPGVLVHVKLSEHNTIGKVVGEYEIPILEVAFSPENLQVDDAEQDPVILNTDDAEEEYQRLVRKYENKGSPNPVQQVYPTVESFAKAAGLSFERGRKRRSTQMKASQQIDHGKKK